MVAEHIFREYDIRGVADRDLTDDTVRRIGRSLAAMLGDTLKRPPTIVVGRDCRRSGPRLFSALISGLTAGGTQVIDVGVGPTPLVYFGAHHVDADGAVMITGSHNPGDENGFKIMRGKGPFFGDDIRQLFELVQADQPAEQPGGSIQTVTITDEYIDKMRSSITLGDHVPKLVVDAGNGAAGPLGLRALRAIGLDPIGLFCDMNGDFPNHHPDPTVPENLVTLIETVKREQARVGIAFDGDGDRMGVVDRNGDMVFGDRLLALFARHVLVDHPGAAVIGEVKCSQAMYDDIQRHGGRPIMWKTGHSLIKRKMKDEHAVLAGEMSGHFFFADKYLGFDDGIYAALRIAEIISKTESTVGELLADLPTGFATPEIRADCADDKKFDVVKRVTQALSGRGEVTTIDGVRVTFDDGAWALVRASNTGPVVVLRFEAPTEERLTSIRALVEGVLAEAKTAAGVHD